MSFRGLTGPDRFYLHPTACGTGFRAAELASLGPESFDLGAEPPTATVAAACDKRRRPAVQPLPPDVAAALQEWLPTRPAGEPLWPGTPSRGRTAPCTPTSTPCGIPASRCWTGPARH